MLRIKFISIIDSTFCAISLFTFTVDYYIYFSDFQKKKTFFIFNGQVIQVHFKIVPTKKIFQFHKYKKVVKYP